jgi:hypothetical protein
LVSGGDSEVGDAAHGVIQFKRYASIMSHVHKGIRLSSELSLYSYAMPMQLWSQGTTCELAANGFEVSRSTNRRSKALQCPSH